MVFCGRGQMLLQYIHFVNHRMNVVHVSLLQQDCELAQCPSERAVPPHQGLKTQWRFGSWTPVGGFVTSSISFFLLVYDFLNLISSSTTV